MEKNMERKKKPFYKRWWFVVLVVLVIAGIVTSVRGALANASAKKATYIWPDSDLASLIPQPESKYGKIGTDSDSSFLIDIYQMTKADYDSYVEACQNRGYTVDYTRQDAYYSAEDENGYSLRLDYDAEEKTMGIYLSAPSEEDLAQQANPEKDGSATEDTDGSADDATEGDDPDDATGNGDSGNETGSDSETANNNQTVQNGGDGTDIRPEFKEMLDDYETFMNDYCDFMVKYTNANEEDTASMLTDYLSLTSEELEWVDKINQMGNEEMNDSELQYYLEVTQRVTKKLTDAALSM